METLLASFNLCFICDYLGLNSMMMGSKQCNYTWIRIPEVLQTVYFHFLLAKKHLTLYSVSVHCLTHFTNRSDFPILT